MSLNLTNILLIIAVIIILNNIKFDSFKIPETFETINLNEQSDFKIPKRIPIYGDNQYLIYDYDNFKPEYKYQNFDILKEEKSNINLLNKYNDLTKINADMTKNSQVNISSHRDANLFSGPIVNKNSDIYGPEYQGIFKKTNLPSQQDILYDTKFFQPSDADIYNPIDYNNVNYTDRKIQEVYEDLVNNVKKNAPKKKIKQNTNKKTGGFGENTLSNLDWEYEGEDDGMSYDPTSLNLMAL